jgi:peptide chain release factor subunit 1
VLDTLASKEGRGTQLVSLYVPHGRQVSEVLAMLKQENGTASNIKDDTTRKNVQDAIIKVSQRLKLFKRVPENGLVIFCGAIPQNGPGSERIETYVLTPTEPIKVYLYRCDSKFQTGYLHDQLKEKEVYGIMVLDSGAATFATLQGRHLEIIREITSGIPGKHRAGGQSAARFQRAREVKVLNFFKRVSKYANEIFLEIPDLKGLILAGPGYTKQEFEKKGYLHYTLKDKVTSVMDTSYVGEQGVEEVVERSAKILKNVRHVEEKRIMQDFLREIGQDTGLASYGESEVRRNLEMGAVETLFLSEALSLARVKVSCSINDYYEYKTEKRREILSLESRIGEQLCPKCNSSTLQIEEVKDIIDDLAELAGDMGSDVEMISTETEEGVMLKESFGGVAAILRFKPTD